MDFIELNACNGGCVGGVLNVENPYVAKTKLKRIRKNLPVSMNHVESDDLDLQGVIVWDTPLEYVPVLKLDDGDMMTAMEKMAKIRKLLSSWRASTAVPVGLRPAGRWQRTWCGGLASTDDCIFNFKSIFRLC